LVVSFALPHELLQLGGEQGAYRGAFLSGENTGFLEKICFDL
jgi:hypothetical protein